MGGEVVVDAGREDSVPDIEEEYEDYDDEGQQAQLDGGSDLEKYISSVLIHSNVWEPPGSGSGEAYNSPSHRDGRLSGATSGTTVSRSRHRRAGDGSRNTGINSDEKADSVNVVARREG